MSIEIREQKVIFYPYPAMKPKNAENYLVTRFRYHGVVVQVSHYWPHPGAWGCTGVVSWAELPEGFVPKGTDLNKIKSRY